VPITPSKGSLQLQSRLLPFDQKSQSLFVSPDAAPHPLHHHDLQAPLTEPFHDLSAEPALAECSLEHNHHALVFHCEVHDTFSPALALNVCQNEPLDLAARLKSISGYSLGQNYPNL